MKNTGNRKIEAGRIVTDRMVSVIVAFAMVIAVVSSIFMIHTDRASAVSAVSNPKVTSEKTTWDYVFFGNYPQTEIVSDAEQCGTYGNSYWGKSSDYIVDRDLYLKLQDASYDTNGDTEINGKKYRRIGKSDATYETSGSNNYYNWSDSLRYHYFKYEKIKWRALEANENYALLLADKALDDKRYNENKEDITWERCTMRSWMNGYSASYNNANINYSSKNFIDTAFTSSEQNTINDSDLLNKDNIESGAEGGNDTTDKIFLLAESDVWNTDKAVSYGFVKEYSVYAKQRGAKSSTYAKAMGVYSSTSTDYSSNCYWWLRSPGNNTFNATYVTFYGNVNKNGYDVNYYNNGVRPALRINLNSEFWSYAGTVDSDGEETVEITSSMVSSIESQNYTGQSIRPAVTIKNGGTELENGRDYTVTYQNNTNAGTAQAIIKGIGNYTGNITVDFNIKEKSITTLMISSISAKNYTGSAITPLLTISDGEYTLIKDKDYKVTYQNNINAGTAQAIVTGIGNYTGSIIKEFQIDNSDMPVATLENPRVTEKKSTWDCVYFGSYPQTEIVSNAEQCGAYGNNYWGKSSDYIVDMELYAELQKASYDANGDTEISGTKYRRIRKSDATYGTSGSNNYYNWSDSSRYHYFKYEKIKWRALEANGNYALLLADKALDDKSYNENYVSITWERSTMRSWMNGYSASYNNDNVNYESKNFIDTAFTSNEQKSIYDSVLLNKDNIYYGTEGGNDTTDKIFLLAESDVWNTDKAVSYGFVKEDSVYAKQRGAKSSTYAKAMGVYSSTSTDYASNCYWWLRSPGNYTSNAAFVGYGGVVARDGYGVLDDLGGVRPALQINLKSDFWSYAGTVDSDENKTDVLTSSMISSISNQNYTGNAITPSLMISDDGYTLVKDTDYIVSYQNNINAGTAQVIVTGKGNYTGSVKKEFVINKKAITSPMASSVSQQDYTGQSITPAISVKDGAVELKQGTDYIVSYQNNTNAGTAKVIVTGKGNYTGSVTKEFVINKKVITSSMALSVSEQHYTGQSITPAISIKDGTTDLKEGTDYVVSYQDNINAGIAKVIVTGKGNYTGSITNEFVINKKKITSSMVSSVSNQVYTGKNINPSVKVADGTNNIIKNTDYAVSYSNNKEIGKAKVIITGIGNYTGKVTKNFTIGLAKTKLTGKVSKTKQKKKLKKVKCEWKKITGAQKYKVIANGKTCWAKSNKISITFKKPVSSLKLDIRAYRKVKNYSTYGPKYEVTIK